MIPFQFTGGELKATLKALHLRQNRQLQKERRLVRILHKVEQDYRESKLRDALLITGGCQPSELPGTSGALRETIHSITNHITALRAEIALGGGIIEALEALERHEL